MDKLVSGPAIYSGDWAIPDSTRSCTTFIIRIRRRIHIDYRRIHTVQQDMGVDKGFDFYPPLTDSDVDKVSAGLPDNVVKEYLVLTTSLKYRPSGRPFLMKSERSTKPMTTWQFSGAQSFLSKASILALSWMGTVSAVSVQRLVEAITAMSRRTLTKSKSSRNGISDRGFIPGMTWTTCQGTT